MQQLVAFATLKTVKRIIFYISFNRRKGRKIYEHPAKDSICIELLNLYHLEKFFMNCKQQTPIYIITNRRKYE